MQRVFPDRLSQMQCEYHMMRAGLLFPETEDGLAPFQRKWNPDMRYVPKWESWSVDTEKAPSEVHLHRWGQLCSP